MARDEERLLQMDNVEYGLKPIITRSDLEGISLSVDMPVVGADGEIEKLRTENPALHAAFAAFDEQVKAFGVDSVS